MSLSKLCSDDIWEMQLTSHCRRGKPDCLQPFWVHSKASITRDRLPRGKPAHVFQISFTWHGSLHKKMKTSLYIFMIGLINSWQWWGIITEQRRYDLIWETEENLAGSLCSSASLCPCVFREKDGLFLLVQWHTSRVRVFHTASGKSHIFDDLVPEEGRVRVTFLLLQFSQMPSIF
jgi:hypothetical protein